MQAKQSPTGLWLDALGPRFISEARVAATMAWDGVLVRFGEIGIKSPPVRRQMLDRLRQNLEDGLVRAGVEGAVQRMGARIWMAGPDADALADVAVHTFGVVSCSPARLVETDFDALCGSAAELALAQPGWRSFAVRARREGDHGFSSQELAVAAGSAVWNACEAEGRPCSVDLSAPELEVHIDVRQARTFLFLHNLPGPGGLPVGCQGSALLLLSDEASCVAAWLLMRRGCKVTALHAGDTGSLPVEWAHRLVLWGMQPDVELLPVCSGTTSKTVLVSAAANVAQELGAHVLATGERTHARLCPAPMPVLRPVCGLDEDTYRSMLARVELPADEPVELLDDAGAETAESLLAMRRQTGVA